MTWHFGRSWNGHPIEDGCVCEKAPCGLVVSGFVNEACPQHDGTRTIRQSHYAEDCPATKEEA